MRSLLAALLLALASPSAHAIIGDSVGLDPSWDWKELKTDHFRVAYPAELEPVARKVADYYEEAHAILAPRMHWEPRLRTQVVVVDNTDLANGLTASVLRIGIVLMVTPPEDWFSTGYYDDWLRLVVLHEYVHHLNMDITRDAYQVLRWFFGDVLLPNAVWPTWMLEGLAVYMETRFTQGGRGRSPFYDMVIRAAAEEKALGTERFVALNRINGPNPWFPGGETPYLFGYQMMNQVARSAPRVEQTIDSPSNDDTHRGDVALGEMSYRSGRRFPYFINGNLENITTRDWYSYWDQWVSEASARAQAQLEQIRKQPVTAVSRLTSKGYQALGPAISPDGKWLAYTHDHSDRRSGLYLMNLATRETERVGDKLMGVGMAFTPDSRTLVYSAVERRSQYHLFSDLFALDLESRETRRLTHSLRARDPHVSADGKHVVFTIAESATVGIAVAPLLKDGSLGPHRALFMPPKLDRASHPRFSPDGSRIVFSLHRNGRAAEDLLALDLAAGESGGGSGGEPRVLLADGKFNRHPTFNGSGKLYFVSDKTGVYNVYELEGTGPRQVTNVTSGLWFPTWGRDGLYASAFSMKGWDIAKVEADEPQVAEAPIDTAAVSLTPPPAPPPAERPKLIEKTYKPRDYSPWPSLIPRQWAPTLAVHNRGFYMGGEVSGFDALDRHRYALLLAYNTYNEAPDAFVYYANRSLGPTITLSTAYFGFTDVAYGDVSISYPFRWTYSALVPSFSFGFERDFSPDRVENGDAPSSVVRSRYIPRLDQQLFFSNTESSRLAVTTEGGRTAVIASRVYFDPKATIGKFFARDTEHFRVTEHAILSPSLQAAWTTREDTEFTNASVDVVGVPFVIPGSVVRSSLDFMQVRGYPDRSFTAKSALLADVDFTFPIEYLYRGSGTDPIFADSIYGFVFAESAYFPKAVKGVNTLPSGGGGVKLLMHVLHHVPLVFSAEYHQGFRRGVGGKGQFFLGVGLGGIGY